MRYLFGDSSTFPLNHNFIDTLTAAVDTAVALLEVDEAMERARRIAEEANTTALTEIADLDRYAGRLARALGDRDNLGKATAKVIGDVADMAARELERARCAITSWRDTTIRRAREGCGPAAIMAPLDRFMARHDLPFTVWGLRWRSGQGEEPVQAQAYAVMQRGLAATLTIDIPKKHLWAQPVRVSRLEKKLTIQLMGKTMFGREALRDEHLDRYYISRVTHTTEREAFILSKKPKEASAGLRVSVREGEQQRVTIVRVDHNEMPTGEPVPLDGIDAVMVKRLWGRIQETVLDLVHCRLQLLAATIHGKSCAEIPSPATIAITFIQSVAPLTREMMAHSRSSEELQLKRDLGDGRREELFVAKKDLLARVARLAPSNRQLFDVLGLEPPGRVVTPIDVETDAAAARKSRPSAQGTKSARGSRRKQAPLHELPPPAAASGDGYYDYEQPVPLLALQPALDPYPAEPPSDSDLATPIARIDQLPFPPSEPPTSHYEGPSQQCPIQEAHPWSVAPFESAIEPVVAVPAPSQPPPALPPPTLPPARPAAFELPPPSAPPRRPQLRVVSGGY
jgi:hypothetical protein